MHATRLSGVVFLFLFCAYGLLARDIQLDFWASEELFNARTWPMIVAAGGVLLSVLYILFAERLPRRSEDLNWIPLLLLLVLMSCYGLALEPLGFILSTTLFLILAYLVLGERRPLWLVLCSLPAHPAMAAQAPNIVIILSDDQGYADLGVQAAVSDIETPNIDELARHGVRMTHGYVTSPQCVPSRAGLMTGRYQQRFGHELNIPARFSEENGLPATETTLPDLLRPLGYRTIGLGKWHLGYADRFHPCRRGFLRIRQSRRVMPRRPD